jgi:hypothetical protein
MHVIYKYELQIANDVIVSLPETHKITDIHEQNGKLYLWCLQEHDCQKYSFHLRIFGTGQEIKDIDDLFFIKTVHMSNGLVWHIYAKNHE